LAVASKASGRARSLDMIGRRNRVGSGAGGNRGFRRGRGRGRGNDEPAPSTATDLTALAPRRARLVGGPFVGRALFVRSAAALARDFTLLFGRHRRKPSTLFALSCIHATPPVFLSARGPTPRASRDVTHRACRLRRIGYYAGAALDIVDITHGLIGPMRFDGRFALTRLEAPGRGLQGWVPGVLFACRSRRSGRTAAADRTGSIQMDPHNDPGGIKFCASLLVTKLFRNVSVPMGL